MEKSQTTMIKKVLAKNSNLTALNDFLKDQLQDAGYSAVDIVKTPVGTTLNLFVNKPGLVIGRRGSGIRSLTEALETKFNITNPQISVTEVKIPELNSQIMASRLASSVQRGQPIRRAANWTMRMIMNNGARGVEIQVAGKMRSDRASFEKFKSGVVPKAGFTASQSVDVASCESLLKVGLVGIKVFIALPDKHISEFKHLTHKVTDANNTLTSEAPAEAPAEDSADPSETKD